MFKQVIKLSDMQNSVLSALMILRKLTRQPVSLRASSIAALHE